MPSQSVPLGTGIYYPAEAARLISIRPDRLRRWVRGYTYWTHDTTRGRKHSRPPILSRARRGRGGDLPVIDRAIALSFLELMELRIVRELVDDHRIPLQKVRTFADKLKVQFGTKYPFASRQVFTSGTDLFATLSRTDRDHMIGSRSRDREQLTATELFRPYLADAEFDEATFLARKWWPLGQRVPVVLDPRVSFGAPTIQGRRVRTAIVAGMAEAGSESQAASAYGVSLQEVRAALRFESELKRTAAAGDLSLRRAASPHRSSGPTSPVPLRRVTRPAH